MSKKRRISLLSAALLAGAVLAGQMARASAAEDAATQPGQPTTATSPATARAAPPARQKPDRLKPELLEEDSDSPVVDTSKLLWQMLAYVLVILVLGGVAIFVFKRVLPRIRSAAGRSIAVEETIYLGPRQTVHLLHVGGRRFLVAGTRERITLLAEVTEAFPSEAPGAESPG